MLSYNNGVYYGSKKALVKFALEMGIDEPDIQNATKKKMKKELAKSMKPVLPPSPDEEEEEEEEDIDIDAIIGDEEEEEEEPVGELADVIHQVSTEKPLTKQQQEMIEKIRKCIGI